MDILEGIRARRSIRKYKPDPVSIQDLKKVLEAVQWSPSWTNSQCWELVVVDDPEMKLKLQGCLPLGNPSVKAVVEAPYLIAVCGKKGRSGFKKGGPMTIYGDWIAFDLGIASEHLCLAAKALGLGTVHVGLIDHKKAKEALKLPDDIDVYELIPLGYPLEEPTGPGRKSLGEFVHWNSFGNKKEI